MNLQSSPARRKILFTILYFCEGAPIGFIWWMLPAQLRSAGVPVDQITAGTSLLVLPWALKFLWAPLVDTIQSQRWTLKAWIVSAQAMMILSLVPMIFFDPAESFPLAFTLLLLHTVSAATQDVAIDALCISSVQEAEYGSVNGWMQAGMLAGRSLFGGVGLYAAAYFGNTAVLLTMIVIIAGVTILIAAAALEMPIRTARTVSETLSLLRSIASKRSTWFAMAFAIFGGFAYEGVGIVAGPYFVDKGITTKDIGLFFSIVPVLAMMAGAMAGGYLSDRYGKRNIAAAMTSATATAVFILAALELIVTRQEIIFYFGGMTLLYFTIGMFTSSTYALFMEITDKRLGATQFSAYMGGTNLCESAAGLTTGWLVVQFGYAASFSLIALVSLTAIPFLFQFSGRRNDQSSSL